MRPAVVLLWATIGGLAGCSSAPPEAPTPVTPRSDEPTVVIPDSPRSEATVLEALWARERRIAELEAEVARLRALLDASRGTR